MKTNKYKDQNNANYKKILIVLFVMIFILFLLSIILEKIQNNNEKKQEVSYENISTIEEVIEYYGSAYISEEESKDKEFYLDVYLKFKVLPYDEDDNSNEEYYNKLLEDCAKVIYYKSFKMIDKENDIIIKVICKDNKIASIIINDIEDYFIYMDSQISMKKYVEIPTTEFSVTSDILKQCIDNNWNSNINFGQRDSIFDEYYIYFDEGLKVRTIDDKIYNIIFDKRYQGNVINSLFPGIDLKTVKNVLGNPTFEDKELEVIGYKNNDIYVFFTQDEISVYRVINSDIDDFFDLADKFLEEKMDLLEFMNELTYMWPDYSEYVYSSKSVFLSYPLKGVEIKINYDDTNGILLYNNIKSSLSKTKRYLENTNFVARLQSDSVYETEKRRFKENENLNNKCDEYKATLSEEELKTIGKSFKYDIYADIDLNNQIYSMKFISTTGDFPNRELNDSIDSYLWLNSDYFLYSKMGKGIYGYNLNDGTVQRLLEGSEDYELKEFKDGILKYDNKEINIEY